MRFPRQARIFRGHLDPAPIAAVVFLLVIFMQLSSLLYTPGVLIQLQNTKLSKNPAATTISASSGWPGAFSAPMFLPRKPDRCSAMRRKASAVWPPSGLAVETAAPKKLVEKVNALFAIELADGSTNLFGTANPKVVVAVNYLGQYSYDNRLIGADDLKKEPEKRLQAFPRIQGFGPYGVGGQRSGFPSHQPPGAIGGGRGVQIR